MRHPEYAFVHVPKTGGSSVNELLRSRFHRRLTLNYPTKKRRILKTLARNFRNACEDVFQKHDYCVSGHLSASTFDPKTTKLMTFLRDPVEREISLWRYVHREKKMHRSEQGKRHPALDMTLEEFLTRPAQTYRHFLDVDFAAFDFVGSMDDFDADLVRLARYLDAPVTRRRANAAPTKTIATSEHRALFAEANPEEVAIYDAAMLRREATIKTSG